MTGAITSISCTAALGAVAPAAPANAGAELAKYESQLSDWVHCASCKTAAGKAKIAEITDKIQAIKTQMKRAEEARPPSQAMQAPEPLPHVVQHQFRLDQLGAWLDLKA
jgi:hypothetical protein